ncbi:hypothetical protein OIV83_003138 [Microbotryomycetes sp. JL201]|nr:hypothetical protein OIV83_003138 [Microbotryomycetes sp. JL201]
MPEPVPTIRNYEEAQRSTSTDSDEPQSKQKSRFALQREQEQLERTRRFNITAKELDEATPSSTTTPSSRMIGQVLERDIIDTPILAPSAPGPVAPSPLGQKRTGFPASGKGVFAKAHSSPRATLTSNHRTANRTPIDDERAEAIDNSLSTMMQSISQENARNIAKMSPEEVEEQQRQIRQDLGLSDSIIKMLEARGRKKAQATLPPPADSFKKSPQLPRPRPPPAATVHPPREDEDEGSPEYIRRHFFPNEPQNPALDWIARPLPLPATTTGSAPVFGLDGQIKASSAAEAPVAAADLHASSTGEFTVSTLLHLTSSAVSSQRATALTVLERILSRSENATRLGNDSWRSLRTEAVARAGLGLFDKHVGVAGAALALSRVILATEKWTTPPEATPIRTQSSKVTTVLATFLGTGALAAIAEHLAHPRLAPATLAQVIDILQAVVDLGNPRSPTKNEHITQLIQTPQLVESLSTQFIAVSWPCSLDSASSSAPRSQAIALLDLLAKSSRSTAKALSEKGCVDSTLRFLGVPPWELSDEVTKALGYKLVTATLSLWTTLARYGLHVSLRTRGAGPIESLLEHLSSGLNSNVEANLQDKAVLEATLNLLTVWTTAAIDPHITNHDITWSQVEPWHEFAVESIIKTANSEQVDKTSLTRGLDLLTARLEGCKINKERQGLWQRKAMRERLAKALLVPGSNGARAVKQAFQRLMSPSQSAVDLECDAALLLGLIRICRALEEPDETHLWRRTLNTDETAVGALYQSIAQWSTGRHSSSLLLALSSECRGELESHLAATLCARPGDEVTLRDELMHLISHISSASIPTAALEKCSVLGPFVQHVIVTASGGRVVAPLHPTPKDIKLTSVQYPFVSSTVLLEPTWAMSAVDELLRSGSSPVFHHLPRGWNASELDVLQGALAMTAVYASCSRVSVKAPQLLFDLVKVFMLEKDAKADAVLEQVGVERELFRNDIVSELMSMLVRPLRIQHQPAQVFASDLRVAKDTIEGPSSKVSSAPFYQMYTDLVGLYDSISLGNDLFGLVLLPPLAMSYPADFRQLFWFDYAHNLPKITTRVQDVVSDRLDAMALSSFLNPVETNETVLEAYIQALLSLKVTQTQNEFLFYVAIHHLQKSLLEDDKIKLEVKKRWATALISVNVCKDVVKAILGYEQVTKEGEALVLPPACYVNLPGTFDKRKASLLELVGSEDRAKVDNLLA